MVPPASHPISRVGRYSRFPTTGDRSSSTTGLSPSAVCRSSTLRLTSVQAQRGVGIPLHRDRTTPERQRIPARTPPRFGLCPVRSPLLRASSLFLGVLRCFSSPGSPPVTSGWQAITPAGLPHSEISGSPAASASPEHFVAWPRPSSASSAKASTVCPSFRSHLFRLLPSSPPRSPPGHRDTPGHRLPQPMADVLVAASGAGHAEAAACSPIHPPGWSRAGRFPSSHSLVKVHPQVEPRGLEPRTSAVQGRRSPG